MRLSTYRLWKSWIWVTISSITCTPLQWNTYQNWNKFGWLVSDEFIIGIGAEYLHGVIVSHKIKLSYILGEFWFCKNDLFWLLHVSKDSLTYKVMDTNRMTCGGYKYIGKPVIPVLRLLSVCLFYFTFIW